ncbi:unnamed protein product [Soboliphyme baturini]|uniref:GHMP_kinases_C domain-containing protein n=1 Tax=Soboliphyme baturini TaxID=241478 RepID=A0A183IW83_9BILA|nr:unnamed protein product [Soboliphyme baturini]
MVYGSIRRIECKLLACITSRRVASRFDYGRLSYAVDRLLFVYASMLFRRLVPWLALAHALNACVLFVAVADGPSLLMSSFLSSSSERSPRRSDSSKRFLFDLQELCRINNQLLIALGVGHPKVDQICTTLARYGIHPKMTGAGGGGSVFAFLKPGTEGNRDR